MTNADLITRIENTLAASYDTEKKFNEPFDIRCEIGGDATVKAKSVCVDGGEVCLCTEDDFVIPLSELTNRELYKAWRNLLPE